MDYKGRRYLGSIASYRYDHISGAYRFSVRHFNGEYWPLEVVGTMLHAIEPDHTGLHQ